MAGLTTPTERYGLREVLLATAVVLVALPFAFLAYQVRRNSGLVDWDTSLADWLHRHMRDNRPLTVAMETASFVGSAPFLVPVIGGTALWAARWSRKIAIFLVVTCLGGSLVNTLAKGVVDRARPVFDDPIVTELGKSFPSGHAMGSLICYGALLVVLLPRMPARFRTPVVVATAALVAVIGFSRLALGVHYLSDVLAGFILGAAWLIGSVELFGLWRREDRASN